MWRLSDMWQILDCLLIIWLANKLTCEKKLKVPREYFGILHKQTWNELEFSTVLMNKLIINKKCPKSKFVFRFDKLLMFLLEHFTP